MPRSGRLALLSASSSLTSLLLPVLTAVAATSPADYEKRAEALIEKSLVIDGELSLLMKKDGEIPVSKGAIKSLSGIDAGFWTFDADSIARVAAWTKKHSDAFVLVSMPQDLNTVRSAGKFGALLFIEEPPPLRGDLSRLQALRDSGLSVFQIAYGDNNELGAGFRDDGTGLSAFGVKVVRELNRLGVVIDVSHVGKQTVLDVARLSTLPILAGHANSEKLAPHPRNKSDEELIAIARTGGVIGLTPISAYLKSGNVPSPDLDAFLAQIDYVVKLVGIDHVGLGSDSYLEGTTAKGYELGGQQLAHPRRWRNVIAGLMKRGYSNDDLKKLLGINFKRAIEANFNVRKASIPMHDRQQVVTPSLRNQRGSKLQELR